MMITRPRLLYSLVMCAVVALLGGCSVLSPDNLPTAQTFHSGWTLKAQLGTVVSLPAQSKVLVDDTDAGMVKSAAAKDGIATVTLSMDKGVDVDSAANIEIRQDTLLGDTYVSIHNPAKRTTAVADGGTLARSQAKAPVQIEQLFRDLANFLGSGSIAQLGGTVNYINGQFPADPNDVRRAEKPLLQILNTISSNTDTDDKTLDSLKNASQQFVNYRKTFDFLLSPAGVKEFEGISGINSLVDTVGNLALDLTPLVPLAPTFRSLGDVVNSVLIPFLVPGWPNYTGQRSTAANLEDLITNKVLPFFQRSPKVNIRTVMTQNGLSNRDVSAQMVRTLRMMGLVQ